MNKIKALAITGMSSVVMLATMMITQSGANVALEASDKTVIGGTFTGAGTSVWGFVIDLLGYIAGALVIFMMIRWVLGLVNKFAARRGH